MSEKVVPHEPITRELLYEWGYIRSGKYLLNWNGIYLIENGDKWDYGSPRHYTIDEEHPFIKDGECTYLDELNDYQLKRSGRGLAFDNEQKRRDYYEKYGKIRKKLRRSMSNIKVITVCHNADHAEKLIASLDKQGYDTDVLITEWKGFGTKILATLQHLKEHPEIEQFVFCDAFDVLFLGNSAELLIKVNGDKIVFNAEMNCWPDGSMAELYPPTKSRFKYLNSGLYYASAKAWLKMVEENKVEYMDDDQLYFTKLFLSGKYPIELDKNCTVFQTLWGTVDADFDFGTIRAFNLEKKTLPVAIHGNGRAPMDKFLEMI